MKYMYTKKLVALIFLALPYLAKAQSVNPDGSTATSNASAVQFLNITPDSRSGAMGDAGVAISPDVNANYWNPAKLAFLESDNDLSLSYSPWLRNLVPDINLAYLSFAHKIDDRNTLGASLRYFNLGSIQLVDDLQNDQGTYKPNELSIDGSFARKFGNNLSLGLTLRYIYSNFATGAVAGSSGAQNKAGNAVSAGVSMYYRKSYGDSSVFAFGAHISNIGSKIAYTDFGNKDFLPTNLKLGVANTWRLGNLSKFTIALDLNKLLVPVANRDSTGAIAASYYDTSVPSGIFRSFGDSQGLKLVSVSPGVEYWYNDLIALRAGYFYESQFRGNRRYATFGVGLKYQSYSFDFSYLTANQQNSPLANTLRFTLSASFGGTANAGRGSTF